MPGINWKYSNDSKSKKFWSISSDYHIYLGQLFIDFEFNQSLGENTPEFTLTQEQIEFLINGLECRLDRLIEKFNPDVPMGLTTVSNDYKGKQYSFYVKMSRNHELINGLIRFHKFLVESKTDNRSIIFWGEKN